MFKGFKEIFMGYVTRVGLERVRREFLSRDDRYLDDIGVSRDLLQKGVGAWPWKPVTTEGQIAAPVNNRGVAASQGFPNLASLVGVKSLSATPDGFCS